MLFLSLKISLTLTENNSHAVNDCLFDNKCMAATKWVSEKVFHR